MVEDTIEEDKMEEEAVEESLIEKPEGMDDQAVEDDKEYVSQEQFSSLLGLVTQIAEKLKEKEKPAETGGPSEAPKSAIRGTSDLPLAWKEEAARIFQGTMFFENGGKIYVFSPLDGQQVVTVVVPREVSNAPSSHWDWYKQDWRSFTLRQGNSADPDDQPVTFRSGLTKIARNLKHSGKK